MKLLILTVFLLLFSQYAFAYIDPGSGSIILQALFFIIAAIGTFFTFFKEKVRQIFSKIFKKKKDSENKS